jgi:hypothetical protein
MGGALWRYGTQEEGCTNQSFIHSNACGLCNYRVLPVQVPSLAAVDEVIPTSGRVSVGCMNGFEESAVLWFILLVAGVGQPHGACNLCGARA